MHDFTYRASFGNSTTAVTTFTGKNLCWSPFNKVADLGSNKHEEGELFLSALSSVTRSSSSQKITVPSVRKGYQYEKDWSVKKTAQLVNLWSVKFILTDLSLFKFSEKILKNRMC